MNVYEPSHYGVASSAFWTVSREVAVRFASSCVDYLEISSSNDLLKSI